MKKMKIIILISVVLITFISGCDSNRVYKYGYINKKGEIVIETKYKSEKLPNNFSDGLALVKIKGKYGYIDTKGNIAIEPIFEEARDFSEGMAAVRKPEEMWGYINVKGEMIVDCSKLRIANDFSDGLARVCFLLEYRDSNFQYIDKEGKVVFTTNYGCGNFHEGLASMLREGEELHGYMDKTGEIVIEPQFYSAKGFKDGFARVQLEPTEVDWEEINSQKSEIPTKRSIVEEWGYINKDGDLIIEPKYNYACDFYEGLAHVGYLSENGYMYKTGYINKDGEHVIEPKYIQIYRFEGNFKNDLALVPYEISDTLETKFTFINKEGKEVLGPFDFAYEFSEGLAYASKNGKNYYINEDGEVVFELDPKYKIYGEFKDGLAYVGW